MNKPDRVSILDGAVEWYQHGKRHRLDGPAVEHPDGYRVWYQHGKRHRLDGPAFERPDGYRIWYRNGDLHRLDGPAVEWSDGTVSYCIDGKKYDRAAFDRQVKELTQPKEKTKRNWREFLGHVIEIIK